MKNLNTLAVECERELDLLGIKYRTVRNWSVNTRAKCRWGQCKIISDGVFDINISERLLDDGIDDNAAKSTIIHELLHTVKGGFGHKGEWQRLALIVNSAYPCYNIRRTETEEEKGLRRTERLSKANYKITCLKCGFCIYRQRASKVVINTNRYRCRKCGGKLSVQKLK